MQNKHIFACYFTLILLSLAFAGGSKGYLDKGTYEIGGNFSYYSQDYSNLDIKQYFISFEPIFNYYVTNGFYISPVVEFSGCIYSQNEFNYGNMAGTLLNHYLYSLGAGFGFSKCINKPAIFFGGLEALYNIDEYKYKSNSSNGPNDGFAISPFLGVKFAFFDHVAFPITAKYRILFNKTKTRGDFDFKVGLLCLCF